MKVLFISLCCLFFLVGAVFGQTVTKYMIKEKDRKYSIGLRFGSARSTAEKSSEGFVFQSLNQSNLGLDFGLYRDNGSAFKAKLGFAGEQNRIGSLLDLQSNSNEISLASGFLDSHIDTDIFFQTRLMYLFKPVLSFKRLNLQPLVGLEVLSGVLNNSDNIQISSNITQGNQSVNVSHNRNSKFATKHNPFAFFGVELNLIAKNLPLYINYTLGYRQPLFSSPFIQYEIIRSINNESPTRYSGEVRGTAVMNSFSLGFIF